MKNNDGTFILLIMPNLFERSTGRLGLTGLAWKKFTVSNFHRKFKVKLIT